MIRLELGAPGYYIIILTFVVTNDSENAVLTLAAVVCLPYRPSVSRTFIISVGW